MKRINILLAILLFCLFFSKVRSQEKPKIDSLLSALSKRSGDAGFSVCVVKKNKILYTNAFGYRDKIRQLPVTTNTVFPVGSCTKAFTAALFGLLPKPINLDTPVHSYLPQLKFYRDQMTEQITIRDLLCHRSGLPRHEYSWFLLASDNRDSMLARIQYLQPNCRIAEKWQYNNFGYLALGMTAARILKADYEEAVRDKILEPLSMERSYFSFDRLLAENDRATGYKRTGDSVYPVKYHPLIAMAPAGGLNSTAIDMGKWLSAWLNSGSLLPESYKKQAINSYVVTKPALPAGQEGTYFSNYGFGWFLSSYRGHYRAEHGGNIDGFTSTACFYPSDSLGIVVLCNRENSLLPAMIRNLLTDVFLGLPKEPKQGRPVGSSPVTSKPVSDKTENVTIYLPGRFLPEYTGTYGHPGYGQITVGLIKDSLLAKMGQTYFYLQPAGADSFMAVQQNGDLRIHADFGSDSKGSIERLSIPFEPTMPAISFLRRK